MSEKAQPLPLDESRLGITSSRLATIIFAVAPEVRQYAGMWEGQEPGGTSLDLDIPSPTGDPMRNIDLYLIGGDPSLFFGPSHTHCSPDADGIAEILDMLCAILADQLVIIEESDAETPRRGGWVDLRDPDALLEEVTSQYAGRKFLLKSWSGKSDRQIDLDAPLPSYPFNQVPPCAPC